MWQTIWRFFTNKHLNKSHTSSTFFSSLHLVQTPANQLSIGMYVSELDIPWLESPFLFQGFTIETEKDLKMLSEVCQYVYIDVSKQKKRKTHTKSSDKKYSAKSLNFREPPERLGSFETEITKADKTYQETGVIVTDFMEKIANGGGVDGKLAKEAVAACVNNVLHSPDAILWLSQLKNKDQYTSQHSLNVCVLSIVLGRHIGLSTANLNNVGLCGMMHDMGKMLVPLEILNKPGKLEPDELLLMQSHTTLGHELLKSSNDMFYGAVETALSHHERMDGKGYPRQTPASVLSYFSNIVAIADMYDAITSDRVYQKGRTHHEATKIMLDVSGSHLDAQLVVKFIESLGAYPPGSFVELNYGAIAVVVEESSQFKLQPKVLLIMDENKNPTEEEIIDLSTIPSVSIKSIIDPLTYQIDRKEYYLKGVVQKGFATR